METMLKATNAWCAKPCGMAMVALVLCVGAPTGAEGQRVRDTMLYAPKDPPRRVMLHRGAPEQYYVLSDTLPVYRFWPDPQCLAYIKAAKERGATRADLDSARSCAFTHDSLRRVVMQAVARWQLTETGRIAMDIPEFHDEQRLPGDSAGALGPSVGIFATPYIGDFTASWQIRDHSPGGVLAAFIVLVQEGAETLPASYKALHLEWGLNCLFLEDVGGARTPNYRAWMVQPSEGAPCRAHHAPITPDPANRLDVVAMQTGFPQRDMIAAARFEEDAQGRAVFGVPCLARWCRVGVPGFRPLATSFCQWGFVTCARREELIPSWYDEQQFDQYTGTEWVAAAPRIALVPRPNISALSEGKFVRPVYVADLYVRDRMSDADALYRRGVRQGRNRVELVHDVAKARWQYILTPINNAGVPGTPVRWAVLGPHRHYDAPVPGTSRFRNTFRDPGIWGPCGSSCCPSDGHY